MNLLDENIPVSQRVLLRAWRVRVRQIGDGVGSLGMGDDQIIPLLHGTGSVTFFTDDQDFYHKDFCHPRYSLVWLDVIRKEQAVYIRRVLRHPTFRTWAKRKGKVLRVRSSGITFWQRTAANEQTVSWPS